MVNCHDVAVEECNLEIILCRPSGSQIFLLEVNIVKHKSTIIKCDLIWYSILVTKRGLKQLMTVWWWIRCFHACFTAYELRVQCLSAFARVWSSAYCLSSLVEMWLLIMWSFPVRNVVCCYFIFIEGMIYSATEQTSKTTRTCRLTKTE